MTELQFQDDLQQKKSDLTGLSFIRQQAGPLPIRCQIPEPVQRTDCSDSPRITIVDCFTSFSISVSRTIEGCDTSGSFSNSVRAGRGKLPRLSIPLRLYFHLNHEMCRTLIDCCGFGALSLTGSLKSNEGKEKNINYIKMTTWDDRFLFQIL